MPHPPKCLAIIVCDDVIEDKRTGKKSIIGAFNQIWSTSFPSQHDKLVLFVSLTDGKGESDLTVRVVRELQPDYSGEEIFRLAGKVKFGNPLDVAELVLTMHKLLLPQSGNYTVLVEVGGGIVGERRIRVEQVERSQANHD